MADLDAYYRSHLKQELDKRIAKNPRYSLRAFSKYLGVDNSYLSKLLSGKILLSLDLADQFTRRLKIESKQRAEFLLSAAEEQRCHALYLLDPKLTECDETKDKINQSPRPRKR